MITKENIELYKAINNEIENFARRVMQYIKLNEYTMLLFHVDRAYCVHEIIDGQDFVIRWKEDTCHDCPEGGHFVMPLDVIYNDTWQEWIDKKCEDIRELWLERERKDRELREQRERRLLEELKEKYGEV